MNLDGILAGLKTGTDVMKWLNDNILKNSGALVGVLQQAINFIKGLFSGDGGGIFDFFKNLFAG